MVLFPFLKILVWIRCICIAFIKKQQDKVSTFFLWQIMTSEGVCIYGGMELLQMYATAAVHWYVKYPAAWWVKYVLENGYYLQ